MDCDLSDLPYENSAFTVIAGLPTQRPINTGQSNFARCYRT